MRWSGLISANNVEGFAIYTGAKWLLRRRLHGWEQWRRMSAYTEVAPSPAADTRDHTWVLGGARTRRAAQRIQAGTFLTLPGTGLIISIATLKDHVGHGAFPRETHPWSASLLAFGPSPVALALSRGHLNPSAVDPAALRAIVRIRAHWRGRA